MPEDQEAYDAFIKNRKGRSAAIGIIVVLVVVAVYAVTLLKGPGFIDQRAAQSVVPLDEITRESE